MTKRQEVLQHIKIICAKEGKVTRQAMRLYMENRINRQAFDEACREGIEHFKSHKEKTHETGCD